MSGFWKNVKALDPHLWYPEVGHGDAADGRSLQSWEVSWRVQQESGDPVPGAPPAEDPTVNPGQSFLCKFAGESRKEGFFGQWLLPISWPKMNLSAKLRPSDAAQQLWPNLIKLAGLCDKCTPGRRKYYVFRRFSKKNSSKRLITFNH